MGKYYEKYPEDFRDDFIRDNELRIQSDPGSPWSEIWRAEIDLLRLDDAAATARLELLSKHEVLEVRGSALEYRAVLQLHNGNRENAVALLREGASLEEKPGPRTAALADVLGEGGQDEEAEALFQSVLRSLGSEDVATAWALAHSYQDFLRSRNRGEEAKSVVERILAQYPDTSEYAAAWPLE